MAPAVHVLGESSSLRLHKPPYFPPSFSPPYVSHSFLDLCMLSTRVDRTLWNALSLDVDFEPLASSHLHARTGSCFKKCMCIDGKAPEGGVEKDIRCVA